MARTRPWMDEQRLVRFWNMGLTYDDIARANFEATGWRPGREVVARKFQRMGLPPRQTTHHRDLIPWRIRQVHRHDPVYYALQAVSRERQGFEIAERDTYRARWLLDLCTHRGTPMVVDYLPDKGFIFLLATDDDTDIVRFPDGHTTPPVGSRS